MAIDAQVKVLESIVEKMDSSIEKLTEVSNSIGKLLAVHDERLNNLEKDNDKVDDNIKEIHSRITTISREICDKIDSVEGMIENKLKESAENSTKQHAEIKNDIETKINVLSDRVSVLETWRWIIIGGATVIGYLADKAIKLFTGH
jgi:chromosome segregation ATPase